MFFLYTIIAAVIAAVIGIVVAVRTKKDECVTYTGLDKAGRITNLVLLLVYVCLSPMYLFIGMICTPAHDGYLGFVGYAVSVVIASASLFCFPGLGFSVALRKKGRSKLSFAVQFAGVVGIGLTILLYTVFAGNLLRSLN